MLIAGLIGMNLVLALLAVWAIRLLRNPGAARGQGAATEDPTTLDTLTTAPVDQAVASEATAEIDADSLEAMFAFDSRRITADQH